MNDTPTNPVMHRPPRIGFNIRAQPALRRSLGLWNMSVMALDTVDKRIVEAIRLRAATYHDCHT